MSKIRDDEPAYIFCSAETKVRLEETFKRSGADIPPDNVFVIADVIPFGFCVVAKKADFLGWLFNEDNDAWTIPEDKA